jgi:type VI secretion system protein ImpH
MVSANGRTSVGLGEQLLAEPYRFDFFQAVRLLESVARHNPRRRAEPVGYDQAPEQEVVRFRAMPALSFPAAAVHQIRSADEAAPAAMSVTFLGLTGPLGALPPHYTSQLLRRLRNRDLALRDFLDLFNHRTVSFFYRAWEKYRLPFAYERSRLDGRGEAEDLVTRCLYCLVGMGTRGLRDRRSVDDEAFVFYGGHFAHFPRSAVSLEAMLGDYFEMPVRVQQVQGQRLVLEEADRSLLPGPEHRLGRCCQLGVNLISGDRVWDVQSKFRVRIGPLGYSQFRGFMPDGDGLRALGQMTRAYVGPELDFDVQVVLRRAEAPECRLEAAGSNAPRLGWNTWVHSDPLERDVEDAVFQVLEAHGLQPVGLAAA